MRTAGPHAGASDMPTGGPHSGNPSGPVAFLLTSAHPTVSSLIIVAHTQSRRNERPRRNPSLMVKPQTNRMA